MRSARPSPVAGGLLVPVMAVVGLASTFACTLTTPLGGLTSGADPADAAPRADAGGDAPLVDGSDAAPVVIASCDALKRASPDTPDGFQLVDPDGPEGPAPPFRAYCDMTNEGGGWMLVTADMLGEETTVLATPTRTVDARGGLVMRVYVNSGGCGNPRTRHRVFIADRPSWTRVRMKQIFAGQASCWHVLGGQEIPEYLPLDPNLIPFEKSVDVIRDAVRMGGSVGDAFDGDTTRCDTQPDNFWAASNGLAPRSATVVLRRRDLAAPSGLSTGADCGGFGPGETSDTWWEYRDIYVK